MRWFYKNREERSKWLAERFSNYISQSNSLLDVGCYHADLKQHLPEGINYTGIDVAGKPDIFINLDEIERLPFNDDSFDIIVCADVLEHLEEIHLVFDEICRVSARYVIITLPNAYASIPEIIFGKIYAKDSKKRESYGKFNKYYGLPFEKPQDRHRWFLSFDEIIDFINYRAKKYNFDITAIESEYKYIKRSIFKGLFFMALRKFNKNLVDRNIIVFLEKKY